MFIEIECSNCAWSFLLWSLIPSKAGLANTPTVGYLGRVLGAITPKNQNTQNTNTSITNPPPKKTYKKQKKNKKTQPHKHKDWWLFPGFASVGSRTIYHKKGNISVLPPKKNPQKT